MLKDLLYIGLGGAALAREKVEEELERLKEKGKLSKEEIDKVIERAKTKGEEEEKRVKEELRNMIKEVMAEVGVATKEDIEALKKLLKK
jgi:polyhydroxyalkanoate synthesis regulator phasin